MSSRGTCRQEQQAGAAAGRGGPLAGPYSSCPYRQGTHRQAGTRALATKQGGILVTPTVWEVIPERLLMMMMTSHTYEYGNHHHRHQKASSPAQEAPPIPHTDTNFRIYKSFNTKMGGEAGGAKAEITASVPAGVHWRASPQGMPLWGSNRFWPGSGRVPRCLGPGFTVLALRPGFRPILIHSFIILKIQ